MKKVILIALLMIGTTIIAQKNGQQRGDQKSQFTPQQKSQLMVKKMTLALDLNDAQQKDMSAFISEGMAKRESQMAEMKAIKEKGVRPTSDQRFSMEMKMLDQKIAAKKRIEKILTPAQLEKWHKMKKESMGKERGNRQRQGNHKGNRQSHKGKN